MTTEIRDTRVRFVQVRSRSVAWRVKQFVASSINKRDEDVDDELRRLVGDSRRWELLERLTPFDRSHHLRVYRHLVGRDYADPDLLLAALLHDVGKADESGRAGVISRSLRVLLRRTPRLLCWITSESHPRVLHGLYLAEHHARLGADLVRASGASERCCTLIARHEDSAVGYDLLLAALVAADDAVIR